MLVKSWNKCKKKKKIVNNTQTKDRAVNVVQK